MLSPTFPKEHRTKLHITSPIERLNGEIKRGTDVVGIFPNDDAMVRLVGALLVKQTTNGPFSAPDSGRKASDTSATPGISLDRLPTVPGQHALASVVRITGGDDLESLSYS